MKTHNLMWEDKSTHMADRAERQREKAKEQGTRERERQRKSVHERATANLTFINRHDRQHRDMTGIQINMKTRLTSQRDTNN